MFANSGENGTITLESIKKLLESYVRLLNSMPTAERGLFVDSIKAPSKKAKKCLKDKIMFLDFLVKVSCGEGDEFLSSKAFNVKIDGKSFRFLFSGKELLNINWGVVTKGLTEYFEDKVSWFKNHGKSASRPANKAEYFSGVTFLETADEINFQVVDASKLKPDLVDCFKTQNQESCVMYFRLVNNGKERVFKSLVNKVWYLSVVLLNEARPLKIFEDPQTCFSLIDSCLDFYALFMNSNRVDAVLKSFEKKRDPDGIFV